MDKQVNIGQKVFDFTMVSQAAIVDLRICSTIMWALAYGRLMHLIFIGFMLLSILTPNTSVLHHTPQFSCFLALELVKLLY